MNNTMSMSPLELGGHLYCNAQNIESSDWEGTSGSVQNYYPVVYNE